MTRPPLPEPTHGCVFCGKVALYRQGTNRMGWVYTCRDHIKAVVRAYKALQADGARDRDLFQQRAHEKHSRATSYSIQHHAAPTGYQMRHR